MSLSYDISLNVSLSTVLTMYWITALSPIVLPICILNWCLLEHRHNYKAGLKILFVAPPATQANKGWVGR